VEDEAPGRTMGMAALPSLAEAATAFADVI
jgi:hypothetical protein